MNFWRTSARKSGYRIRLILFDVKLLIRVSGSYQVCGSSLYHKTGRLEEDSRASRIDLSTPRRHDNPGSRVPGSPHGLASAKQTIQNGQSKLMRILASNLDILKKSMFLPHYLRLSTQIRPKYRTFHLKN